MRTLLRELRGILEHERAVYGDVLPLDDDAPPSETTSSAPSANATEAEDAATPADREAPAPAADAGADAAEVHSEQHDDTPDSLQAKHEPSTADAPSSQDGGPSPGTKNGPASTDDGAGPSSGSVESIDDDSGEGAPPDVAEPDTARRDDAAAPDDSADGGASSSAENPAPSGSDDTSNDTAASSPSLFSSANAPATTPDATTPDDDPKGASASASSGNATSDATSGETDDLSDSSPNSSESTDAMPNRDLFGNEVNPAEDPSLPPWERIASLIPDDAPYKDAETLEEVESYLANTVLVPIDEDRENPVFGVGDPEADLVIIGEAPGRDEDKEGEPFVGRAGQLLDKILDAINFTREDVYITNILKSRPPRNRDPHAEEVEAHLPLLYKQIALIQPKIILCVGKVAGNTMLDRSSSLSSLRDTEHDFYGIPMMVTYHPAALLRNSQWKRPTWEDVKLLRTRYDRLTEDE